MSKPARTTTPGTKVQPPPLPYRDEDGRVSGARRALNYAAYDGLMHLGTDAFSTPLPPPKSSRPLFAPPRLHIGWYMLSAAAGFSIGAVALAVAFRPALAPERPRVALADTMGYAGPWTIVENNQPTRMREVLEPIDAPRAPVIAAPAAAPSAASASTPMPEPAAAAAPAPEPAAVSAAAAQTSGDDSPAPAAAPAVPVPSAGGAPAASHRHSPAEPVEQLSRAQVIAAMRRVEPQVNACFHGTGGSAMADVTILGRTGRVTTAQISGMNGGVGSCIARAVRNATFPAFKAETLKIRYPFAR